MTRQGESFNEHLDSYEKELGKRERRTYEKRRAQFAVANQLIERRKALRLTQQDLSTLTGVSQPEISRIERGSGNPTVETLGKLAAGLKSRLSFVEDSNEYPRVAT